MRIYVGTLHTIENEFKDCVAAIRRQTHPNFEHFVFSELGNEEAHATLYGDFAAKRDRFDLMIKVDADMVLCDERLFERIDEIFCTTGVKVLSIAVHDWFSDHLIGALNSYRQGTNWCGHQAGLFVDNVDVRPADRKEDCDDLAPAALHCPNPSPFQAFHFGIHKALKVIQPKCGNAPRVHWRMREHWENIARTRAHFERSGDRRLGLAVLGAEYVFAGDLDAEHVSYSHPELHACFSRCAELDTSGIKKEIRRQNRRTFGWLPDHMRQACLWYLFRKKRASLYAVKKLVGDVIRSPRKTGAARGGDER